MINPFDAERDQARHYIWHRLVAVDSDAFVLGDWNMIEPDFDADHFEGVRCGDSTNPDDWKIVFPRLEDYRDVWLASSREFLAKQFVGVTHREAVYRRIQLTKIDIAGDRAVAHKKFTGDLPLQGGTTLSGSRQTLYRLHRQQGVWKIVGFLGQLPLQDS